MERLLIILAVLTCAAVCVGVVAMAARGRRPPMRLDSDIDEDDEHLVLTAVGPLKSPIDRSAQVLDARVRNAEALDHEPAEAPRLIEARGDRDHPRPPAANR